jgi:hypothetical protein
LSPRNAHKDAHVGATPPMALHTELATFWLFAKKLVLSHTLVLLG